VKWRNLRVGISEISRLPAVARNDEFLSRSGSDEAISETVRREIASHRSLVPRGELAMTILLVATARARPDPALSGPAPPGLVEGMKDDAGGAGWRNGAGECLFQGAFFLRFKHSRGGAAGAAGPWGGRDVSSY
jgi:hypothetical protein